MTIGTLIGQVEQGPEEGSALHVWVMHDEPRVALMFYMHHKGNGNVVYSRPDAISVNKNMFSEHKELLQ